MKKVLFPMLAVVLTLSLVLMATPALAKGGSSKGTDVWFQLGSQTYKNIFYTTGSGIVHEWRYEPNDLHLVFKPLSKFPNQPDGFWGPWSYNIPPYQELDDDDGNLADFLTPGDQYWVQITIQD